MDAGRDCEGRYLDGEKCRMDRERLVAKHLSTVSESSPDSSPVQDSFNNSGKRVGSFHELWRDFLCSASASGSWPSGINTAVFNGSVNLHEQWGACNEISRDRCSTP